MDWLSVRLTRTVATGLVQKGEFLSSHFCKEKLDWDNPVCHKNYSKQTWNLDCNLFTSQGGGLMLCGWRVWKGMRGMESYLPYIHPDWLKFSASRKKTQGHVFDNRNLNALCIQCVLPFYFGGLSESLLLSRSLKWSVWTALLWTKESVAGQGRQSSSSVPCFQTWLPWTLLSSPLLLSRSITDRHQSLKGFSFFF